MLVTIYRHRKFVSIVRRWKDTTYTCPGRIGPDTDRSFTQDNRGVWKLKIHGNSKGQVKTWNVMSKPGTVKKMMMIIGRALVVRL